MRTISKAGPGETARREDLYINRALIERNNYEQQLFELQEPYVKLGEAVSAWYRAFQAGQLGAAELKMARPVLEALMLLPDQARRDLCGGDPEAFLGELTRQ